LPPEAEKLYEVFHLSDLLGAESLYFLGEIADVPFHGGLQ
jgi:hypothetical protein